MRTSGEGSTYFYNEDPKALERRAMPHLSEQAYSEALDRFIRVCVDVLFINRERKSFYLMRRTTKPVKNWYLLGGSRFPGETKEAALSRVLNREINMPTDVSQRLLEEKKIAWVARYEMFFKDREENPQDHPTHAMSDTYAYEPNVEELETLRAGLNPEDFDVEAGIREFTLEEMEAAATKEEAENPGFNSPWRILIHLWHIIFDEPQHQPISLADHARFLAGQSYSRVSR
jgi:ADP-ribose pyrophosphatase YjhB (NUDIX family)